MRRVLVHIKEFTRRGVMAGSHLGRPGLPRSALPCHQQTTAGPEQVKRREGALKPVRFLLGRQPKPEPGKAAADLMEPETTAPSSPPPGRVVRPLGGWWGKGSRPIPPKDRN